MNSNLEKQIKKLCRNNCHNDSFSTRKTYAVRMNRYLEWASERGLQKIQNISDKQVSDYVSMELDRGISERTLKSTLCAIRYFNKMACDYSNRESRLTISNDELGIGSKKPLNTEKG